MNDQVAFWRLFVAAGIDRRVPLLDACAAMVEWACGQWPRATRLVGAIQRGRPIRWRTDLNRHGIAREVRR